MMKSEFIERTNYEPNDTEYRIIEESYYEFGGNKDEFCKWFLKAQKSGEWEREMKIRSGYIEREDKLKSTYTARLEDKQKHIDALKEIEKRLREQLNKADEDIETGKKERQKLVNNLAENAEKTAGLEWDKAHMEQEILQLKAKLYDYMVANN